MSNFFSHSVITIYLFLVLSFWPCTGVQYLTFQTSIKKKAIFPYILNVKKYFLLLYILCDTFSYTEKQFHSTPPPLAYSTRLQKCRKTLTFFPIFSPFSKFSQFPFFFISLLPIGNFGGVGSFPPLLTLNQKMREEKLLRRY